MKSILQRQSWKIGIWLAALVPAVSPAGASEVGDILTAQVQVSSYAYLMENLLYTHVGDNRGFGPQHDLARTNIFNELQSYGLEVELHPFLYNDDTYYNVVGTQTGWLYPDEYYIIGAHYDSVNNPGADDNASGTAVVLEAARILSPHYTEYTIRYILWDREEQGLVGSSAYAEEHINDTIVGVLNMDMIAHDNHTTGPYEVEIYGWPESRNMKEDLGAAVTLYSDQLTYSLVPGIWGGSDFAPFAGRGFQACSATEWNYSQNNNYHTWRDAIDISPDYINYDMCVDVCKAGVGFLIDHANVTLAILDGDLDSDGDVDLSDFVTFAGCFGGAGATTPPGGCDPVDFASADLDGDNDVDLADFITFSGNFTG